MARVLIQIGGQASRGLLGTSTLIGRHWSCHIPIERSAIPLYWVEVRWSGSRWMWRCLEGEDNTTGSGAVIASSWRHFRQGSRIHAANADVTITLVDDARPSLLLHDLCSGVFLEGDDCLPFLDDADDGFRPRGQNSVALLVVGQVFVVEGRVFRIHLPEPWTSTHLASLQLHSTDLWVDSPPPHDVLTLTGTTGSVTLLGESARLLSVYVEIRWMNGSDNAGWLTNDDALSLFQKRGGYPNSKSTRMNWERSRIRCRLREQGVKNVDGMFESRRFGGRTEHRLRWRWRWEQD